MSVKKQISTYPSTGRSFSPPGNFMQNIAGAFLTKKTFTVTDAQLDDNSYLFTSFDSSDIIPLHLIQSVVPQNEETVKQQSLQDFDYELRAGKFKHTLRFDWSTEFHQIVDTYSGTDLYIIYYDQTGKLILAETETSGVYRGVKTDSIILQKQSLFSNGSDVVYSDLDIELIDGETFKVIEVDWLPEQIDKLFTKIEITSIGVDYINFTVKYNGSNVDGLTNTDVTIYDNYHGLITGVLLSYSGGIYQANNFSSNITAGCLTVNSTLYLGRTKYRVQITVPIEIGFELLDGSDFDLLDGVVFDILETTV